MTGARASTESIEARILASALSHIRRDGVKRMAIVRVASDIGMVHANVYRYFPSKAALADRIVSDWLRGIERRLTDIAQAPDPANDKLERFLTYLGRAYHEKAESDANVFAIFADASEAGEDLATRHRKRVRELLSQVLEEGMGTRVFAMPDVRRLERLVLDTMHRFIDPHAVRRSAVKPTTLASFDLRRDRVIRILIQGMAMRWAQS